ncbi:hypothetical protein EVAR_64728_1 [Eumeta japonica]|uniref:Uncharacterized protein n=1 Tax=Eumeta variegata TaxID=151549 RepID=A0A4C2A0H7_EUMVA|nr:hypothetical protein EVAR_64728_1 [Eumeta japonica]
MSRTKFEEIRIQGDPCIAVGRGVGKERWTNMNYLVECDRVFGDSESAIWKRDGDQRPQTAREGRARGSTDTLVRAI